MASATAVDRLSREASMHIWKYGLNVADRQVLQVPVGALFLTVQMQGAAPCLWALVDPSAPTESRTIALYGTGHAVEPGAYIGTVQMGSLVWHAFEVTT